MSISDDLSLLTQGAVFLNKKGRVAKVLFVTNTSLLTTAPAEVQEAHPVQVVYVNEDGDVFNRGLDDFVKKYKFYNVDPDLETRLENLFVFNENDPAFEAASDEPVTSVLKTATPVKAAKGATEIVADTLKATTAKEEEDSLLLPPQHEDEPVVAGPAPHLTVTFSTYGNTVAISKELNKLSQSLIAYAQEPDLTQSLIIHRLTFALDQELTIEALQELFRPRDEASDVRNTVDLFEVRTANSADATAWTSYLGVFPEYTKYGLYATVLVGTDEFVVANDQQNEEAHEYKGAVDSEATDAPYDPSQHTITLPEVAYAGVQVASTANTQMLNPVERTMMHLELPESSNLEQAQQLVTEFQEPLLVPATVGIHINPPVDQLFAAPNNNDIPGAL